MLLDILVTGDIYLPVLPLSGALHSAKCLSISEIICNLVALHHTVLLSYSSSHHVSGSRFIEPY